MKPSFEEWVPVVGFEGLYSINRAGQIRRETKTITHKNGAVHTLHAKMMHPGAGAKSKYLTIRLTKSGVHSTYYIHHLVLEAFVGPCPAGYEACHGDGVRTNNSVENLRWDSRTANHADKDKHGTSPKGERHPGAKLSDSSVIAIRKRRSEGASFSMLSAEFSISRMTAHRASTGASWSHIK